MTMFQILDKAGLNAKTIKVKATKIASSIEGTTADIKYQA